MRKRSVPIGYFGMNEVRVTDLVDVPSSEVVSQPEGSQTINSCLSWWGGGWWCMRLGRGSNKRVWQPEYYARHRECGERGWMVR
jgi:hypothetical protein